MPLNTQPNFSEAGQRYFQAYSPGDDFYEALIDTHRDLSDEQSAMVNARLILLLANHIGDIGVLTQFVNLAHAGVAVDAARWPKLAAYVERGFARPSFKAMIDEESPQYRV